MHHMHECAIATLSHSILRRFARHGVLSRYAIFLKEFGKVPMNLPI
jgi:hypothetical protein